MEKTTYTIEMIPAEKLEYLQKVNPSFTFTGKMLAFNDGTSYPIVNGKYHHCTPTRCVRRTKQGYVVALWTGYILYKDGKVINDDYMEGR